MDDAQRLHELASVFRKLGVRDPEAYAQSEVERGMPVLALMYFLRRAFDELVQDNDTSWMKPVLHSSHFPTSCRRSLERILKAGVDRQDVTQLVRCMQHELLVDLVFLIDGTTAYHFDDPELRKHLGPVGWTLFQVDDNGHPTAPMKAMHELLDEIDSGARLRNDRNA